MQWFCPNLTPEEAADLTQQETVYGVLVPGLRVVRIGVIFLVQQKVLADWKVVARATGPEAKWEAITALVHYQDKILQRQQQRKQLHGV